jgi:hypothetical protein
MRGHTIGKTPELAQPVAFLATKLLNRLPAIRPAHHGADHQQDNIQQGMTLIARDPRVLQGRKMLK